MTNRTMLFCALAVSLAALSVSMVPSRTAPATQQVSVAHVSPMHALTGIAFHSVAPGY